MGRTVLEALVMGKPVVASRVGGLPDLITHGGNGLLVPPAAPSALAHAVCSLLWDPSRLRRMSESAHRSVGSRFSAQAMVDAIDRLYRGLLDADEVARGIDLDPARASRSAGRRAHPGRGGIGGRTLRRGRSSMCARRRVGEAAGFQNFRRTGPHIR